MGLLILGAGCMSGADDGAIESGRFVGGGDAGADVAAGTCRAIAGVEECRRQVGCQWMTATCGSGRIVGGCYASGAWYDSPPECTSTDAGAAPTDAARRCDQIGRAGACRSRTTCRWWSGGCGPSHCIARESEPDTIGCADAADEFDAGRSSDVADAGSSDAQADRDGASEGDVSAPGIDGGTMGCRGYADQSICESQTGCRWWVDRCDGQILEQTCVDTTESPREATCQPTPPDRCHEATSASSCPAPDCAWVESGCGVGPSGTKSVTSCLPDTSCKTDADCPSHHSCTSLWINPCYDSFCLACGGEAKRCVPDSLLTP